MGTTLGGVGGRDDREQVGAGGPRKEEIRVNMGEIRVKVGLIWEELGLM